MDPAVQEDPLVLELQEVAGPADLLSGSERPDDHLVALLIRRRAVQSLGGHWNLYYVRNLQL